VTAPRDVPAAVSALVEQTSGLEWVTDLFVGGSLATGDYWSDVSDLDLVAVVNGPMSGHRRREAARLHQRLDDGAAAGAQLGCVYVPIDQLLDLEAPHATWTHGRLVDRPLSGIARAELVRHGFAVLGRSPADVLPAMSDDEVRRAARLELTGYWSLAVRRPWWWLDPSLADLGLLSMARARHTWRTGQLITKSAALDLVDAPGWLVADVRARRRGRDVRSPRLRTARAAWSDARRTTAAGRHWIIDR
jgi:hypothetical protein